MRLDELIKRCNSGTVTDDVLAEMLRYLERDFRATAEQIYKHAKKEGLRALNARMVKEPRYLGMARHFYENKDKDTRTCDHCMHEGDLTFVEDKPAERAEWCCHCGLTFEPCDRPVPAVGKLSDGEYI